MEQQTAKEIITEKFKISKADVSSCWILLLGAVRLTSGASEYANEN